MAPLWFYIALASVFLQSLISFIGVIAIPFSGERLKSVTAILVSLAVGAMLGDAFIHLLPDAFANSAQPLHTSMIVLAGIFGFFVLEKFFHWHHYHHHDHNKEDHEPSIHPVGWMSLCASTVDNLVDGLVIGSSYLVSIPVGLATTFAIVMHEIPKEMGMFGVMIHSGFSKRKALIFNFLTGIASIVGAIVAIIVGSSISNFSTFVSPFAAGIFIYIAGSDLVPQLHTEVKPIRSAMQLATMLFGVGAMLLVKVLE